MTFVENRVGPFFDLVEALVWRVQTRWPFLPRPQWLQQGYRVLSLINLSSTEVTTIKHQGSQLPAEASVQGPLQARPELSPSALPGPGRLRILPHRALERRKMGVLLQ